jgi:RNA polymerase sigma-70 factor (ECF subfamily)
VRAQKNDKGALLRSRIERLSEDYATVVDLIYYHELSISEVTKIVGIPENTVKTRMFHARKKLSELLSEAGVDRGWP